MNRGLALFLAFCVALGLLAVVAVIFAGPGYTGLALDTERRAAPVTLINFVRLPDGVDRSDYEREFLDALQADIEAQQGTLWWRGTTELVKEGTVDDEWDLISLATVPSGSVLLEIVTSPTYRDREDLAEARREASFTYIVEDPIGDLETPMLATYLIDLPEEGATPQTLDLLGAALERHGGRELWRVRLTELFGGGEPRWDLMLGYGFPDFENLSDWLEDPERATSVSIARSKLNAHRLLVIREI